MEITIHPYEDRYYEDLKSITFNSFELTSFHTDKQIPKNKANEITWEAWCHPVLQSDKKKYCIVATSSNKAIGYIIYGAHGEFSKLLNLKIGSIILLAVDKKFQSRYKIGDKLTKYVTQLFQKNKVHLITVGTDLDNLPAMINYIHNGFKPILTWATFRYYYGNEDDTINVNFEMKQLNKNNINIPCPLNRPISFLEDNKFNATQKNKINKFLINKMNEEVHQNKLLLFSISHQSEVMAYVTLAKENTISSIVQKEFYRMNDLIFIKNDIPLNVDILKFFLYAQKRLNPHISIIELFIKLNDWNLIHILHQVNFAQVHHAMNLHYHLNPI